MTTIGEYLDQLMDFLTQNQADPATYLFIFFLLAVAAAVILPIPIEFALIWNPSMFFPVKALVLGLGKGTGAIAVFFIGARLDRAWHKLSGRRFSKWLLEKTDAFLARVESAVRRSGLLHRAVLCRVPVFRSVERAFRRPPKAQASGWLATKSESFVRKYGILAMYVIMSIPGMVDTIPLYLFSLLNEEGTLMRLRDFALANFLAGVNRAFIIFAVLELLGIRLFTVS